MRTIKTVLALLICALSQHAMADTVTVVEGIKILNDHRADAVFYYQNNWAYFRRKAEEQAAIDSYELIVSDPGDGKPGDEEAVDILLITRFESAEQYADIESAYERVMAGRDLELLSDLQPGEFRENVFVFTQGNKPAAN